jgi:hypothetical protein
MCVRVCVCACVCARARVYVFIYIYFFFIFIYICVYIGARGGVVVKALRYKPAGRGFDSRWFHWNFSVT